MDIKLVPHVGHVRKPDGTLEKVALAQDIIFIDGIQAGYVGHHKGAGVAIIATVSDAEIYHIRDAVDRARGEYMPDRKVVTPPKIGENERETESVGE